ncbi:MAG TPA: TonB-dependent receptor [Puia sp.]|nr:TonB-dependent receptor [Puia sp.]
MLSCLTRYTATDLSVLYANQPNLLRKLILIFFLLAAIPSFAQNPARGSQKGEPAALAQTLIRGKVLDENGRGIAGATIQVKNGGTATTTGDDGSFSILAIPGKDILVISYVGFDPKEITSSTNTSLLVSMNTAKRSLEDVVVIGYGSQKRATVTGAVATLKNDNFEQRPITRVDQALVGQLAGVTVKQNTGIPGKAFSIQVRGTGSISAGNEPLYVIDGFPLTNNSTNTASGGFVGGNPLDNINPNDIESIEVLKDAAAAAIYGSRASNGVVLITTKHGKSGKPRLSVNAYTGYNDASKKLKMLNGQQWIDRAAEMINAAYVLKYGTLGATANDNPATRAALIGLTPGQVNVAYMIDPRWATPGHPGLEFENWQDVIERKGLMQNAELSAGGGTDAVKYFISGNYVKQDGFIKGVDYKAYSVRANIDINASKALRFGLSVAPSYSISDDPGVEGKDNIFHQALSMSPVQEDSVGLYPNIGKNAQYLWSNSTNGVLGKLQYNLNQTKKFRTLATMYGEVQIIKGLNFRSTVNLDNTNSNTSVYTPYITTSTQAARTFNAATNPNLTAATSGSYSTFRRLTFVNENTLTYNTTINNDHNLNLLVGQAYNIDRLDQAGFGSVGGFTSSTIQTLNAAAAVALSGTNNSSQNVLLSYFSRAQYDYRHKYLLSASLRTDGSSRFGANNQYGVFPSASVGWRISQEEFMKSLVFLSDLKFRASYGVNGNNNIGDYDIPTLGSYGYVLGATQAAAIGQAPNTISNPDLKWEKSQTFDIGVDFGIFNNRITGSFDYYNKLNTQLLLNVPVPEATGLQSALQNAGSMRNIGEELELTSRNFVGRFEWSTSINVSHNGNKIVALYGKQSQIIIPNAFDVSDNILRVGHPLNSIYVVRQTGILTQDDLNKGAALYGTGETVGDPKYQDLNGDGFITEADKQIVGHPSPDYTYGMSNTVRYKGFDLSVLVQGQSGGSIYSLLGRAITRTGQGFTDNAPYFYNDRWRSPSSPGKGRVSKAYSTFGFVGNTDWLYSSDYIRVRNITVGYNLKNLFRSPFIQSARVYATAENFFGHDKYYGGLNPEAANTTISTNSAYPEAGDYGGLPLAKSLIVGLNITF